MQHKLWNLIIEALRSLWVNGATIDACKTSFLRLRSNYSSCTLSMLFETRSCFNHLQFTHPKNTINRSFGVLSDFIWGNSSRRAFPLPKKLFLQEQHRLSQCFLIYCVLTQKTCCTFCKFPILICCQGSVSKFWDTLSGKTLQFKTINFQRRFLNLIKIQNLVKNDVIANHPELDLRLVSWDSDCISEKQNEGIYDLSGVSEHVSIIFPFAASQAKGGSVHGTTRNSIK